MVITQGDVWWADFPDPTGSEAGYRRPLVVVQGDVVQSQPDLHTVVAVPLTGQLRWAEAPGNVPLAASVTGPAA